MQVHQHRASGIGDISDMDAAVDAAGEVPDEEGVDGAKERVAGTGSGA